jgi:Uma2 family endonuclease
MSQIPTISPAPSTPPAPPPQASMTAEEFSRRYGGDRVELVDGVVRELPLPFFKHGNVCATFTARLHSFVKTHDLGRVASNDSFVVVQRDPLRVRGADVCFYSYECLPRGPVPEGLLSVAPDLVAEVRSPSETWSDVFIKVSEYLKAGVRVVLVFDVPTMTVSVCRDTELQTILHAGDELTLPDVLPGFAVRVGTLFE